MFKKLLITLTAVVGISMTGPVYSDDMQKMTENSLSNHMVAEAKLTALFIDAAIKAGMSQDEINEALIDVATNSAIAEFWITNEFGEVEFSSNPEVSFQFPLNPKADSQAAPFADLISGEKSVVIQDFQARELDDKEFKYVGVAGIDKPRIVQVGVSDMNLN